MADNPFCIMMVDDEEHILRSYGLILRSAGFQNVLAVRDSTQVMDLLSEHDVALVILDIIMPVISGTELLGKIRNDYPRIPVIVMTASDEIDLAIQCIRDGAEDYLVKPVEKNNFITSVKKILEIRMLSDEVSSLREKILDETLEHRDAFAGIVTAGRKMHGIFSYAEVVARTDRPVLITGETGTGKELLARAIYRASGLKGEFVAVNVAGLDDTMFSDSLFGHTKGAFTGALRERDGLVASASGGVLMLDEIGDLNESSQLRLLRLLENQTYYPLGSDVPRQSNVRIIATTNRDITSLLKQGKFRRDLFYRLCSHSIHLPPLRERTEDIPLLFDHFLAEAARSLKKDMPHYPDEIITILMNHTYPGNVRELRETVFDAVARHRSGTLSTRIFRTMLAPGDSLHAGADVRARSGPSLLLGQDGRMPTLKAAEEFLIAEALRRANGNQGIAASLLGISRQALNKRIRRRK